MITEVVMPQMGADMKEGTVLQWKKKEGDQVARGEIIAEIETDKANVEIESFGAGIFRRALHKEGDIVPVGTVIAVIGGADEDISKYEGGDSATTEVTSSVPAPRGTAAVTADASPAPFQAGAMGPGQTQTAAPSAPAAPPMPAAVATAAPATESGRLRVSPVARRVAGELGVNLSLIQGTGPGGRILRRDVEGAAATAPATTPAAAPPAAPSGFAPAPRPMGQDVVEEVALGRIRQATARITQQSKQTAPHYYLGADIDMTEALALRKQLNDALGDRGRVSVNDIVVLATARTLVQHPKFNAFWVTDHVQRHSQVNIGIAVALDDGLVAPAVLDTANKGLLQISQEARNVAERARGGSLRPEEYTAATFNISNIGPFGIEEIVAIITPPQVGVLGVGAVKEKPVVHNGQIVARSMMHVVLSADHRATDGADGARFLDTLRKYLEAPGLMLL